MKNCWQDNNHKLAVITTKKRSREKQDNGDNTVAAIMPEKRDNKHSLSTIDLDSEEDKGQPNWDTAQLEQLQCRRDQPAVAADINEDTPNREEEEE